MSRATASGVIAILAGCRQCGAEWQSRNACAVAARHHDATGHTTWVEQTISTRYGPAEIVNGGGANSPISSPAGMRE